VSTAALAATLPKPPPHASGSASRSSTQPPPAAAPSASSSSSLLKRDADAREEHSMLRIANRVIPAQELKASLLGRTVHTIHTLAGGSAAKWDVPGGGTSGGRQGACQHTQQLGADRKGAGAGADLPSRPSPSSTRTVSRSPPLLAAEVEWVTIGVLCGKSAPREPKNAGSGAPGRGPSRYAVWTLTDYRSEISVFLMGEAYAAHHAEPEASLFLVARPTVLPARERRSFSLSVSRAGQLVRLGDSPVLGRCRAARKSDGAPCGKAIDVSGPAPYCVFHIAPSYAAQMSAALAARPDLTGTGAGGGSVGVRTSSGTGAVRLAGAPFGAGGPSAGSRIRETRTHAVLAAAPGGNRNISDGTYSSATIARLTAAQPSSSTAGGGMAAFPSHSVVGADGDGYRYSTGGGVVGAKPPAPAAPPGGSSAAIRPGPPPFTLANQRFDPSLARLGSASRPEAAAGSSQQQRQQQHGAPPPPPPPAAFRAPTAPDLGALTAAGNGRAHSDSAAVRLASGSVEVLSSRGVASSAPSAAAARAPGSKRASSTTSGKVVIGSDGKAVMEAHDRARLLSSVMAVQASKAARSAAALAAAGLAAPETSAASLSGIVTGAGGVRMSHGARLVAATAGVAVKSLTQQNHTTLEAAMRQERAKAAVAARGGGGAAEDPLLAARRKLPPSLAAPPAVLPGQRPPPRAAAAAALPQVAGGSGRFVGGPAVASQARGPHDAPAHHVAWQRSAAAAASGGGGADAMGSLLGSIDDDVDGMLSELPRLQETQRRKAAVVAAAAAAMDAGITDADLLALDIDGVGGEGTHTAADSAAAAAGYDGEGDDDDGDDDMELELVDDDDDTAALGDGQPDEGDDELVLQLAGGGADDNEEGGTATTGSPPAPPLASGYGGDSDSDDDDIPIARQLTGATGVKRPRSAEEPSTASAAATTAPTAPPPSSSSSQPPPAKVARRPAPAETPGAAPRPATTTASAASPAAHASSSAAPALQQQQQQLQLRQPPPFFPQSQPRPLSAAPPDEVASRLAKKPAPRQPYAPPYVPQAQPASQRSFHAAASSTAAAAATAEARRRAAAMGGVATSSAAAATLTGGSVEAAAAASASQRMAALTSRLSNAAASSSSAAAPAAAAGGGRGGKPGGGGGFAAALGLAAVDFGSSAVKSALAAGSQFAAQGADEVVARALAKADRLEAVEAVGERLAEVTHREATKWFCLDCDKWFPKPPRACAAEGHDVATKKKKEWRFACVGCGRRTYHTAALCAKPCSRCGKSAWKPASIYDAVKEGSETLGSTPVLRTHGDPVAESLRTLGAHDF
jgi:ribosomal protein L37E